jgi:hypothetical protein
VYEEAPGSCLGPREVNVGGESCKDIPIDVEAAPLRQDIAHAHATGPRDRGLRGGAGGGGGGLEVAPYTAFPLISQLPAQPHM